jgi:hypothetical protein
MKLYKFCGVSFLIYINKIKLFKMKKFSSVIGTKVSEEPKPQVNKEEQRINLLRDKLIKLMNDFLKIQGSGAARTELVNSAISITGKETLADAIIDLISNEFGEEKINLLESLKFEMNDWYTIDNKINQLNNQMIQEKNQQQVNIEKKLISFLEIYSEDSDFQLISENYSKRIKNNSDIINRIKVAESILNSTKYSRIQKEKIRLLIHAFKKRIK